MEKGNLPTMEDYIKMLENTRKTSLPVKTLKNFYLPLSNQKADELYGNLAENLVESSIPITSTCDNYINVLDEHLDDIKITNEMIIKKIKCVRDIFQILIPISSLEITSEQILEMICLKNQILLSNDDKKVILNKLEQADK